MNVKGILPLGSMEKSRNRPAGGTAVLSVPRLHVRICVLTSGE